jgi:predicted GTPase
MKELTQKEKEELARLINAEVRQKPPAIGLVGVSGVGKSSTINAMFKTSLPVSHTVACTKEFWQLKVDLKVTHGPAEGQDVKLIVHDAPGLGEDLAKDEEYLAMYREKLPACDIILWVMSARNRAIALDQGYLAQLEDFHDRIVFGLNQVDLVEPMNWKPGMPIPSREQEAHIADIVADRSERLSRVLGRRPEVIPYSNTRGYNLEALFTEMLRSCAGRRSWIYDLLRNFSYEDSIPTELWRGRERIALDAAPGRSRDREERSAEPRQRGGSWIFSLLGQVLGRPLTEKPSLSAEELDTIETWVKREKTERLRSN